MAIETMLDLPFDLINIKTSTEHFIFQFKCFDDNQNEYSIRNGGVTGEFGIVYQSDDLNCCFPCDITVGNVFDFYTSLDYAYDILFNKETKTTLENYYSQNRAYLEVALDNKGYCLISGSFLNKNNCYKSGIVFSFELDQTYIPEILSSMEQFFKELKRLQGHTTFY